MKRKLVLAFLLVALIPLIVLEILNNRSSRAALTADANEALFAAASQSAASIDGFFEVNLNAVRTEAQLPALVRYLELAVDERSGSDLEADASGVLATLSGKDTQNVVSYSLLDVDGEILISTNPDLVGHSRGERAYIEATLETAQPHSSPVVYTESVEVASLYFSSPVSGEGGSMVGILLVQYDAQILQDLLVENNGLIGAESFGVLFDENLLHLAHGAAPEAIFVPVAKLQPEQLASLETDGGLPELVASDPPPELAALEENLSAMDIQPFFRAEDVATGERVNQVAVTLLTSHHWVLAFFQPEDVFLAPAVAQTRTSVVLGLVIAGLVVVAAIMMGEFLANPIIHLTEAVTQFTAGKLDVRSNVQSSDETGMLAGSFNTMAEQVGNLVTSLEQQASDLEREVGERKRAEERVQAQNETLVDTNQQLATARQQADDANRIKSEFLATMSHELRTPLNAIIGYSQIILQGISGELTDMQRDNQERIFTNGKNLLSLIDDVLDLAKIEAGRMDMVKKPIYLASWLTDTVKQVRSLADEKGLTIEIDLDERMPATVIGDADRLRQIALNLLSNAIKFTDSGQIKIQIQRKGRAVWALIVTDTGVGIASHAQEYIFDEFRQIDGTSSRKFSGTGLGLAIVRNIAMMMGGNVRLASQVGEGSTFTVLLPLVSENDLNGEMKNLSSVHTKARS